MAPEEQLLTIKDIQQICKVGRSTAYDLVATKQLRAVRINKALRIRRSDLEQYLLDREYLPGEQR